MLQPTGPSLEVETHAFLFRDERSGRVLLAAPDVFEINAELGDALNKADAVLFDGTFWSERELGEVKTSARKASAMGHLPIQSGQPRIGSRAARRGLAFIFISTTRTPSCSRAVPSAKQSSPLGIMVGYDGLEFEL